MGRKKRQKLNEYLYETPVHVILNFKGVSDQRNAHVGSPATLLEALGNLDVVYGL